MAIPDPRDNDVTDGRRTAIIAGLLTRERWRTSEVAYYLRCAPRLVQLLIADGTLPAINIARFPDSVPCYRVRRDAVLSFERSREEGAHSHQPQQRRSTAHDGHKKTTLSRNA